MGQPLDTAHSFPYSRYYVYYHLICIMDKGTRFVVKSVASIILLSAKFYIYIYVSTINLRCNAAYLKGS